MQKGVPTLFIAATVYGNLQIKYQNIFSRQPQTYQLINEILIYNPIIFCDRQFACFRLPHIRIGEILKKKQIRVVAPHTVSG